MKMNLTGRKKQPDPNALDPEAVRLLTQFQKRFGAATTRTAIARFIAEATPRLDLRIQTYAHQEGMNAEQAREILNRFFAATEGHHGTR